MFTNVVEFQFLIQMSFTFDTDSIFPFVLSKTQQCVDDKPIDHHYFFKDGILFDLICTKWCAYNKCYIMNYIFPFIYMSLIKCH